MNVKNWVEIFDAELSEENDANDFYYRWIALKTDHRKYDSLEDLFVDVLGVGIASHTKVRIKTFDGAIFIQRVDE